MQDTIGGLGAVDANTYPAQDWADTAIGGSEQGTGANMQSATQPMLPPPPMAQYMGGRPLGQSSPELSAVLAQLAAGQAERTPPVPMHGLFGNPPAPAPAPQPSKPTPVAAPTPEPNYRAVASRAPQAARAIATAAARQPAMQQRGRSAPATPAPPVYRPPLASSINRPASNPPVRNPITFGGNVARNTSKAKSFSR